MTLEESDAARAKLIAAAQAAASRFHALTADNSISWRADPSTLPEGAVRDAHDEWKHAMLAWEEYDRRTGRPRYDAY